MNLNILDAVIYELHKFISHVEPLYWFVGAMVLTTGIVFTWAVLGVKHHDDIELIKRDD